MGRSAKVHKRVRTTTPSSTAGVAPSTSSSHTQVQNAKKKVMLKAKGKTKSGASGDDLLGGADYVALMMGGRRKAKEEAQKLPKG